MGVRSCDMYFWEKVSDMTGVRWRQVMGNIFDSVAMGGGCGTRLLKTGTGGFLLIFTE